MNLRETLINKNLPVHEQLIFCLLLTMVGGFFDAYTFVNCNGIFANAQTGNLIFVGIDLIEGNFREVLHYSIPILSFVVGVLVSKCIETKYKELSIFKHIYILLLIQIFVLFVILFKYKYFVLLKKKESKIPLLIYFTVISVFLTGVILGAAMSKYYLNKAILLPLVIICINLFFVTIIYHKFGRKRI